MHAFVDHVKPYARSTAKLVGEEQILRGKFFSGQAFDSPVEMDNTFLLPYRRSGVFRLLATGSKKVCAQTLVYHFEKGWFL